MVTLGGVVTLRVHGKFHSMCDKITLIDLPQKDKLNQVKKMSFI